MSPKPTNLKGVNRLVIDREDSSDSRLQTVCLDFDNTLLAVKPISTLKQKLSNGSLLHSRGNGVEMKLFAGRQRYIVMPRPGLTEFLYELRQHANPVIYSEAPQSYIEAILNTLSLAGLEAGNAEEQEKAWVYSDLYTWSLHQCIETPQGSLKSLGHFSEYNNIGINKLWIVTDKPNKVDIAARTIAIRSFHGNSGDRELYKLMDKIFIN